MPTHLLPLLEIALSNPDEYWTKDQVKLIAGNCWGKKPGEEWNSSTILIRIELLLLRSIDEEDIQSSKFAENASLYQAMCECASCPLKSETITADKLLPFINPLINSSPHKWIQADIDNLATFLSNVASIDALNSDPVALGQWLSFESTWQSYIVTHPTIMSKVDPVYVVAAIGGIFNSLIKS